MSQSVRADFSQLDSRADFWSLRYVDERAETFSVRKNVPQPPSLVIDRGAMLTAYAEGGCGYAATSDVSRAGLQRALDRATALFSSMRDSDDRNFFICDLPPAFANDDASIIMESLDGYLIVAQDGKTTQREIEAAVFRRDDNSGSPILGIGGSTACI